MNDRTTRKSQLTFNPLDENYCFKGFEAIPVRANSTSYEFRNIGRNKEKTLREIFNIDYKSFSDSFAAVTGGEGNELRRILRVNSSAMLGLLFFANINRENCSIIIDGTTYTRAFFEAENFVHDKNSSVDVVLVSKNGEKLLFLESKFKEPLSPAKTWVSLKYEKLYEQLLSQDASLGYTKANHKVKGKYIDEINLFPRNKPSQYCAGIKQMLSHLIGIVKGPASNTSDYSKAFEKASELELATILFGFDEKYKHESMIEKRYIALFENFFADTNKIINFVKDLYTPRYNDKTISIRNTPLKYSELYRVNNGLNNHIKSFYKFGE